MACPLHNPDDPAALHNPDSPDVQADAWALVRAHLLQDSEAATVILGNGCGACTARFAAGLLACYLQRHAVSLGRDPAALPDLAAQMSRDALTRGGN